MLCCVIISIFNVLYSCSSYVGRIGGRQPVYTRLCVKLGPVIHEIGHALGFWHEQARPDRDQYIEILWQNIIPGKEYNFFAYSSRSIDSAGVPYDRFSIMQYSSYVSMHDDTELNTSSMHLIFFKL